MFFTSLPITLSGDYNIFHNNFIFIIFLLLPVLTHHAHFRCWTKPENQTKTDNFWQRVDDAIKYPIAGFELLTSVLLKPQYKSRFTLTLLFLIRSKFCVQNSCEIIVSNNYVFSTKSEMQQAP